MPTTTFLSRASFNGFKMQRRSKLKQEYAFKSDQKAAFKSYLSKTKSIIESELAKLVSRLSELNLHPQIEYAVLSKGKRLRPLLVILSAESVGGNRNKVMSLALAFELMHTATLVHDDIIDQDEMRRGRPALHKKWSVNDAILTGDALIALSVDLASEYGETILKTVAQSALELCDGEHMDITLPLIGTTEEAYFREIRGKSASLFKAAAYCGALAGGGSPSEARCLAAFGENFGIAYQLRDDLLDLTHKGNMILKDLKNGRITLPLIHSYAASSSDEKKEIERKLRSLMDENCAMNNETAENILQIIYRKGSLDYCEKKIDQHLHQAVSSIALLKDTEYKNYLSNMAESLKFKT